MTSHPETTTASTCPLCGQENQCAVAAGRAPESCWCMARTMPAEALAALPPEARGKACICPACGTPRETSNEGITPI